MNSMLNTLAILFAEADGAAAAPGGGGNAAGGGGTAPWVLRPEMLFVVMAAFFYFFMYLPSKREKARQASMLASIKKNDRVLTSSGIYGVVTDVNKESNKVTLRIDETTNAKIRVTLNSIAQVLGDEPSADTPSK